ncbi:transglutaminase-like domain-containing protein [Aporhodopirellula aestuarii]|uniref:Transglutaminase domain-containing protein n=1 Tax=Aporhodopirellula aestuarii TaxID=2950107 RepID=A0ABT0U2A0_9BACT|nr:transglutaminase domain-containing protein [Aporhodopirellula aestuarii]MCM2371030.1 transglutaminase domain-containing protein [Aporhodopirellula aestuarii]
MSTPQTNRFDLWWIDNRILLGIVITSLALFVGQTFATIPACATYVLVAFLIGIVGEIRFQRQQLLNTQLGSTSKIRWQSVGLRLMLLGATAIALVMTFLWRMADRLTETSNVLLLAVDMISHYCLAVLCILWAVWPHRGHVAMLFFGLISIMGTVAGGGVSRSLPAQTAVGLASMVGFVIAAQIILSRLKTQTSSTERRYHGFRTETWPYSLLALSAALIVASAITQLTNLVLPDVQAEVFAQLKDRFEDADSGIPISSGGYVSGHRLGSVRQSILTDPEGIALLGYCNASPGYLRGNVFDEYQDRSWRSQRRWFQTNSDGSVRRIFRAQLAMRISDAHFSLNKGNSSYRSRYSMSVSGNSGPANRISEPSRRSTQPTSPPPNFYRTQNDSSDGTASRNNASQIGEPILAGTVEIHGQPNRGGMVFLPSASMWIEARGERVGITAHRLIDRGIDATEPWVAGVAIYPEREWLTEDARELLLSVEPSLLDVIEPIASKVCRGAASARGKADRIASYFQNNYQYTLQTEDAPSGIDPITYFLRTRHPAHCELFASASTLMLRSQGVPARYVTGYVMDELNDNEDYYVARNRDAHAWVEYYDDREQRWQSLESTPGREYSTLDQATQDLTQVDTERLLSNNDSAATTWVRAIWAELMSLRITDALSLIFHLFQLPLLIFLIGWLWWRRRSGKGDAQTAALAIARRAMDRRLRRLGWVRGESETLHQFANRIDACPEQPVSVKDMRQRDQLAEAAQWYREHAVKLYRCS